jgi:hypothetical protein
MDAKLRQLCAAQVPGDTQRNLQVDADYSAQTFKHVLLPVWLLTFQYGAKTFRVIVNGETGTIAGKYPKSWIKIALLVLTILGLIGLYRVRRESGSTRGGDFQEVMDAVSHLWRRLRQRRPAVSRLGLRKESA